MLLLCKVLRSDTIITSEQLYYSCRNQKPLPSPGGLYSADESPREYGDSSSSGTEHSDLDEDDDETMVSVCCSCRRNCDFRI